MGTRDARVDSYIGNAAPFARPILGHLRELVHAACPQASETIKWGHPHFEHRGLLCCIAAFKAHCALRFFRAEAVAEALAQRQPGEAMGQFGRITRLSDLPADAVLKRSLRTAATLNEERAAVRTAKA